MKKTNFYFWSFRPDVNSHKLLLSVKIAAFLLFCGLALPANSLASATSSSDDQQQIRVTGTITDASTGEVMTGVNIQVKGTTIGAISDVKGKYSLTSALDQNAILSFSFIGYTSQEITVAGKTVMNVALVG